MIKGIVVDDEQKSVSVLIALLHEFCPQVSVIGSANKAASAKKLITDLDPQLIFLDIEMPYGSGFDLLRSLPEMEAEIIFITAFDHYAVKAFQYAAIDYLLKPVNIEQLENAVKRAERRIIEKHTTQHYEKLLKNLDEKDDAKQTIRFTDKGEQFFTPLADIKYILARGSYTHVHTTKQTFVSTKNLKDFENMLPPHIFCRIHHGHIVNKMHVEKVQNGRGGIIIMKDGQELEIALRRKAAFKKAYNK